jgi:hypothetical protein
MSTKTTFKRIALVAVASLGFGLMTAIPSNAAYNDLACTTAGSGANATSVACGQNSGANNYVVLTAGASDIYVTITGGTFAGGATSKVMSAASTVSIPTTAAGTITVSGYTFSGGAQSSVVTDTVTITVTDAAAAALAASRAAGTYFDHSTAFISTSTGADATVDSSSVISPKAASATPVARVTVKQYSSTDNTVGMVDASAKLVTVAVVGGAGYVSTANNGTLAGPSSSATADASSDFYIYPNGNSGVASVTVSVNGVLLATKSVTFYGSTATVSAAVATTVLKIGSNTAAVKATALDSLGNPVPGVALYLVSGTAATVATGTSLGSTGADGTLTAAVSGVAVGTSSLKISTDAAAADGSISSAATSVRVSDSTPTAVALSFDKASYLPGEAAVITATITNAAGAVPAGPYTVLTGTASSSLVMTSGALPGATITTTGNAGTATFNVNMPLSAGSVTVSATGVAGVTVTGATVDVTGGVAQDAVDAANDATDAANAALDAANAAADAADAATAAAQDAGDMAVAAAEAAGEIAQAAADAAVEATDAANAATDAANAAAEAADAATDAANSAAEAAQAATDAVAALSTQVASLIAGLKAQLTALTNLVIKIQKKVKA